jgi:hypothetical protein
VLDFAKDDPHHLFLSEIRAQHVAVKLRQQGVGNVVAHLRRYVERGCATRSPAPSAG